MLPLLTRSYRDSKGIALVTVMALMAVLFLLGTAVLTNTATEYKISQNHKQSIQAFYDCEAGIAEATARIKNNTAVLDQDGDPNWISPANGIPFHYRYCVTYDPNNHIYRVISEGKDPAQVANKRIIAELKRSFSSGDVISPVYCGSGENRGQPNRIYGDSSCPSWADDGNTSNDTHAPCVVTPQPCVSSSDPLDFDQGQLITSNPNKMVYNTPPLDLQAMADYYKTVADLTSIPNGNGDIGATDDLKVVYINGSDTIAGNRNGYGILVVTGDLHLSGQLHWCGLIIVLGSVRQTGGGSHGIQLTGAILTPNDFDMRGNPDIQWCDDVVRKVMQDAGSSPLSVVSWIED
ncbi:MAG: pilus assembly PilX N-terminal domain-containing protein [bacterium]